MDNRHLVTLKVCELQEAIKKTIQEELINLLPKKVEPPVPKKETDLIPRKKVAEMLKITTVTLDNWRKWGVLPDPVKLASRVYFLRSDIEEFIRKHKQKIHGKR